MGGAVGGGLAAWFSQGQFQPLGQVGQKLFQYLFVLGDTGPAEAPAGGAHLNRDGRLQERLLR